MPVATTLTQFVCLVFTALFGSLAYPNKRGFSSTLSPFSSSPFLSIFPLCVNLSPTFVRSFVCSSRPTVLCKTVGVYEIGYHNRETGKRSMVQVAVMQNIFYGRQISKTFDLKGSLRGRFARNLQKQDSNPHPPETPAASDANATVGGRRQRRRLQHRSGFSESDSDTEEEASSSFEMSVNPSRAADRDASTTDDPTDLTKHDEKEASAPNPTLLDGDFLEFTLGRPLPLTDRAKAVFQMSVFNVSPSIRAAAVVLVRSCLPPASHIGRCSCSVLSILMFDSLVVVVRY